MLEHQLHQLAIEEGFILCGITPAVTSPGYTHLVDWMESGYAAGMTYFEDRRDAYQHPKYVLEDVRSIVALAMPYPTGHPMPSAEVPESPFSGKIARYAWNGDDYHDVIHPKLKRICRFLTSQKPDTVARGVVDTAPILEREFAQLAGLGWRGKNTLLIRPGLGSYFFLALVLTSAELRPDQPFESYHCGTCTACLDACPTDAFPSPGVLDASRCISYLTIESRDPIPTDLRSQMQGWLFGCDICQEVCPWNRRPSESHASMQQSEEPPLRSIDVRTLFDLDDEQFRSRFRKTPFWRTRRRGLLRNAAVLLGNQADESALPALTKGLNDPEPLVRGSCAWAIGRYPDQREGLLRTRLEQEVDEEVKKEIRLALQGKG